MQQQILYCHNSKPRERLDALLSNAAQRCYGYRSGFFHLAVPPLRINPFYRICYILSPHALEI